MRRSALPCVVVGLVLSFAAGCAASTRGAGGERPDQLLIMREQIEDPRFSTAYDVVKSLRGTWLSARGISSFKYPTEVQVYLDGMRLGGVRSLEGISTPSIQYIRYYTGADATTRWGIGHGRGVIFVGTGAMPDDRGRTADGGTE